MIQINEKINQLIECLNIIATLLTEVNITFSNERIFIKAVHLSNHCMIIFKIKASLFEEYNIEKEITYTLDTQNLMKIMKNLTEKSLILFPENDVLIFKNSRYKYKLNYFVAPKDDRPNPIFEQKSSIKLKSSEFFNNISKCIVFDDIGNFEISENKLFINSKSHMVKTRIEMITELIKGPDDIVYFDLTYIDMIKGIKNLFKDIDVYLDKEYPLSIKSKNDDIDFEFILANRVENE